MPTDSVLLLEVLGTASGLSCRKIKLTDLWHNIPNWRAATATANPRHYAYDTDAPNNFNVYPPAIAGSLLTMKYSFLPTRLASSASVIALDDYYETALWAATLMCAFAKNTVRGDTAKSAFYRDVMRAELGIHTGAQASERPQAAEKVGAGQ